MQIITPELSRAPLRNPGKGWVLYHRPEDHRNGSLLYGALGYRRFNWCELQPTEHEYNWQPLDDFIAAWGREGLPVAFGVMTANIHYAGAYVTPRWVFDAGCPRREVQQARPKTGAKDVAEYGQYEGMQVIPQDWCHPVYLEKLGLFLAAVAQRYDGCADLVWYEIRSYGNWGEGHLWPWNGPEPTPDQIFEHHILLHRRLFKQTPLMAAETYFRSPENRLRAARIGVGVRDDGVISYRDGSTTAESDGLAPSCFEWGGSYQQFAGQGVMKQLEDCVRNGHVSYCGFARSRVEDVAAFAANERPLINRVSNLLGYHFVIAQACLPETITPGVSFPLTITWRNDGVARPWFPCLVAAALLDDQGTAVCRVWLDESSPAACAGGESRTETLTARFAAVPAASSRLAIGLFRHRTSVNPDVKLGLRDITAENWHPLASVAPGAK